MRKSLIIFSFMVTLILVSNWTGFADSLQSVQYSYTSPEGIKFISYSQQWNNERLIELYKNLLMNGHGEKINSLRSVSLFPSNIPDNVEGAVGLYVNNMIYLLFVDDDYFSNEIENTLAHEYGHHFTIYWLNKKEGKSPSDIDSGWAILRNIYDYPVIGWKQKNYSFINTKYKGHDWKPEEIIVFDYLMLYGSPEVLKSKNNMNYPILWDPENKIIPSVEGVIGMRDYWENLTGVKPNGESFKLPKLLSIEAKKQDGANCDYCYSYTLKFSSAATHSDQILDYCIENQGTCYRIEGKSNEERNEYSMYPFSGIDDISVTLIEGSKVRINGVLTPKNQIYYRLYAMNPKTKQTIYSYPYFFDISDPQNPEAIAPNPNFISNRMMYTRYDNSMFDNIYIFINNIMQVYEIPSQNISGNIFVPMRELFQSLGAEVNWHQSTKTITATKGYTEIKLQIDSKYAFINGLKVSLPQPVYIYNERTMVPIRFVSQAFDADIRWVEDTKSVYITNRN